MNEEKAEESTKGIYDKDIIFQNKGYILLEFILENYVRKTRGRNAEIGYYYWRMYNDNYINITPKLFQEWYHLEYNENIGKVKSINLLEKPDRKTNYSNALEWLSQH